MNLTIIDKNYLGTYERIEKIRWFEQNRTILFFSVLIMIYSISSLVFYPLPQRTLTSDELSKGQVKPSFFLSDPGFVYFVIFLTLFAIARSLYKRYVALKRIPLMREYEKQVRKTDVKYDFDETRLRIEHGNAISEYRWSMFQKFYFTKGFLIMYSQYYPLNPVWIRLKEEDKSELTSMVEVIKEKFKIEVIG